MTKNKEIITDAWMSGIKRESIKKSLNAGVIYPSFKPYKNTVYTVKLMSKPRRVLSTKGNFFAINLERDGMIFSMNLNKSFRFQLAVLLERYNLKFEKLIGQEILISKDDYGYFSVQLPKGVIENVK